MVTLRHVAGLAALVLLVISFYLLWHNDPSESLTSRTTILAFPFAAISGMVAIVYHERPEGIARYAFYGFVLTIFSTGGLNVEAYRAYAQNEDKGFSSGILLGYFALLLIMIMLNTQVSLKSSATRSKSSVTYFSIALLFTFIASILWWRNVDPNTATSLNAGAVPATVVALLMCAAGVVFMNADAARACLLLSAVSGWWTLGTALDLKNSTYLSSYYMYVSTPDETACILCWVATYFMICASVHVLKQHVSNSDEAARIKKMDSFKSSEWPFSILINFALCITASALVFKNDSTGLYSWVTLPYTSGGLGYYNTIFIFGFLALWYYILSDDAYIASCRRYLLLGLMIYLFLGSNNNVFSVLVTSSIASEKNWAFPPSSYWDDTPKYPISIATAKGLLGGKICGWLSIFYAFLAILGPARTGFTAATKYLLLPVTLTVVGLIIAGTSVDEPTARNLAAYFFAAPVCLQILLLIGGMYGLSIECVHASLFVFGYNTYWLLTAIDGVVSSEGEKPVSSARAVAVVELLASLLALLPAWFTIREHHALLNKHQTNNTPPSRATDTTPLLSSPQPQPSAQFQNSSSSRPQSIVESKIAQPVPQAAPSFLPPPYPSFAQPTGQPGNAPEPSYNPRYSNPTPGAASANIAGPVLSPAYQAAKPVAAPVAYAGPQQNPYWQNTTNVPASQPQPQAYPQAQPQPQPQAYPIPQPQQHYQLSAQGPSAQAASQGPNMPIAAPVPQPLAAPVAAFPQPQAQPMPSAGVPMPVTLTLVAPPSSISRASSINTPWTAQSDASTIDGVVTTSSAAAQPVHFDADSQNTLGSTSFT